LFFSNVGRQDINAPPCSLGNHRITRIFERGRRPCWWTDLIIILTNLVVKTQKRHHFPKEQQSDPTPRFQSVAASASARCFSSLHLLSHKGRKGSHDCLFASHEL